MRSSSGRDLITTLLKNPAMLVHHFILASQGNVGLRLSTIAGEVAVEMRTLERAFFTQYKMTMTQFQVKTRLEFAKWLLDVFPPTKISAIAATLGYERVQDFNRFFKKHMHRSPRSGLEANARALLEPAGLTLANEALLSWRLDFGRFESVSSQIALSLHANQFRLQLKLSGVRLLSQSDLQCLL